MSNLLPSDPLERFEALAERRDRAHFGFLRQALLGAASSLSILVALHKEPSGIKQAAFLYVASLSLFLLAILFLSIALYAEVSVSRSLFVQYKAALQRILSGDQNTDLDVYANPSIFYRWCEALGYLLFLSAMLCLTLYAAVFELGWPLPSLSFLVN
jgi:hypothetical protein